MPSALSIKLNEISANLDTLVLVSHQSDRINL